MMPDKIYIDIDTFGFIHGYNAEAHQPACQEYICKEALMEWANERYKSTISNVGCYTGHSVWGEVIEHLNEM